ncbi:MAG: hypothetical protein QXY75_04365 [Candidatus Bathyarchaeia archaeon]
MDPDSTILLVLHYAGGSIRGMTRLQKILFLVQQEAGLGSFNFEPYKFGPFSPEIDSLVKSLEEQDLLKIIETNDYNPLQEAPTKIIILTDKGKYKAKESSTAINHVTSLKTSFLVKRFVNVPLTYLIAYIYAKYPEYTTLSEIKEIVEKWRETYGLRLGVLPR